jgi:hypothetical protein
VCCARLFARVDGEQRRCLLCVTAVACVLTNCKVRRVRASVHCV